MFDKKDEQPRRVGAREKIANAVSRAKADAGAVDQIKGKKEGKTDYGVLMLLIYILASALAFVLMQAEMKTNGLNWKTGFDAADRILFSGGTPSLLGSPDLDQFAVPLARGLAICLVSSILPTLTFIWVKLFGNERTNPYVTFWSVSAVAFCVLFAVKDFLLPMFI